MSNQKEEVFYIGYPENMTYIDENMLICNVTPELKSHYQSYKEAKKDLKKIQESYSDVVIFKVELSLKVKKSY